MSKYHIPFHIQEEIMKKLPVKSLIQFRTVSKAWKSLIDSSQFIAAHSLLSHTQQQHLLVSYKDPTDEEKYVCYIDDDTFPQQRSVLTLPPPLPSAEQLIRPSVVGSSHGLVCICGLHPIFPTELILLWNPWIRKCIAVVAPDTVSVLGFGVCPVTNDPKMVSIAESSSWDVPETSYQCEVMIYTLSSGKWRNVYNNLPTKPFRSMVVTNRFIYWPAFLKTRSMIMSFNVTNEIVEVIDLPDSLARGFMYISKLRESLAILKPGENISTVWMMEDGIQRSFTKLFTINSTYRIMSFTKSGVPIMRVKDDDDRRCKLVVYEPNSEYNNVLDISGSQYYSVNLDSYIETLFLLDRSDCISY